MIKSSVLDDLLKTREFLSELGFSTDVNGFNWYYDRLCVTLYILDYDVYDDLSGSYVRCPNIRLNLRWLDNETQEDHSVLITQNWESIRMTMIGSSITDLGIKPLNRSIKLYCLLNGIEYVSRSDGNISCMALKLNPRLILKLGKV